MILARHAMARVPEGYGGHWRAHYLRLRVQWERDGKEYVCSSNVSSTVVSPLFAFQAPKARFPGYAGRLHSWIGNEALR
jgi:hypothetical protein